MLKAYKNIDIIVHPGWCHDIKNKRYIQYLNKLTKQLEVNSQNKILTIVIAPYETVSITHEKMQKYFNKHSKYTAKEF